MLCDRLGIFVNGSLQCIGNPKEVKTQTVHVFDLYIHKKRTRAIDVQKVLTEN